jgi:hypothetical protein
MLLLTRVKNLLPPSSQRTQRRARESVFFAFLGGLGDLCGNVFKLLLETIVSALILTYFAFFAPSR